MHSQISQDMGHTKNKSGSPSESTLRQAKWKHIDDMLLGRKSIAEYDASCDTCETETMVLKDENQTNSDTGETPFGAPWQKRTNYEFGYSLPEGEWSVGQ